MSLGWYRGGVCNHAADSIPCRARGWRRRGR